MCGYFGIGEECEFASCCRTIAEIYRGKRELGGNFGRRNEVDGVEGVGKGSEVERNSRMNTIR